METELELILEQNFPLGLQSRLITAIKQKQINTIWLGHSSAADTLLILWLRVTNKVEVSKMFNAVYNTMYEQENNMHLVLLDEVDMEYHKDHRNSFVKTCLYKATLLYKEEGVKLPSDYLYNSDLEEFKDDYLDKQELLASYCSDFIEEDLGGSCYMYLKSFEYDLGILETLLLGTKNTHASLSNRLLQMEKIYPPIKTLFVKREQNVYYLINQILQDSEAAFYNDWGVALKEIQEKLKQLVIDLLNKLEQEIFPYKKSDKKKTQKAYPFINLLEPLIATGKIEEVYKFHETLEMREHTTVRRLYMLLIVSEEVTEVFKKQMNNIEDKYKNVKFTLITHTRLFIQEYLYMHVAFFKKVLSAQNLVYSSGDYPAIHWQTTYEDYYEENLYYLKHPLETIDKTIKTHITTSTAPIFISSQKLYRCMYIKLQVYIIHHLSYLPRTSHLNTLYYLALYKGNKDKELRHFYTQLQTEMLEFMQQNPNKEDKNLLLDTAALSILQGFFEAIEVA